MKTIAERALEHVERFAVQFGSRPAASAAKRVAADDISGVFEQSGLSLDPIESPEERDLAFSLMSRGG